MNKEQIIHEALKLPTNAITYHVSAYLTQQFPEKALLEGTNGMFHIEDFARAGHCTLEVKNTIHNQTTTKWFGRELDNPRIFGIPIAPQPFTRKDTDTEEAIFERLDNAWITVEWQGQSFEILLMHWMEGYSRVLAYWILADNKVAAQNLFTTVSAWNAEIRGEVLVFNSGCWSKDTRLFEAIRGSSFDNLILEGTLKQQIRNDLQHFFNARSAYEEYGIPWKRGILFVGPPGNGKTHTVKAIINELRQPCLYVKSFRSEHHTDEDNISKIFSRARQTAPCVLVFEDLDSLLTTQNRSFFLNELDGFAANVGIMAIATTNHPERLDPSILDRPSRFDRKYPFDIPGQPERLAYIEMWNNTLQAELRLSRAGVESISQLTDGFSYAYLKELFLSSMMHWIGQDGPGKMDQTMPEQVETLRVQMVSAPPDMPVDNSAGPSREKKLYRAVFGN